MGCYLVLPALAWRMIRGVVPMAVMPILIGLLVAVAAARFGFDKDLASPSPLGERIGWAGVLALTFSAGLETRTTASDEGFSPRLLSAALLALLAPFALGALAAGAGALDWVLARPAEASPTIAAAAIGLCMAVSALPVLVGIVRELGRDDQALGGMALRIAALHDAILWVGLSMILLAHNGEAGAIGAFGWRQLAAIGVFGAMFALRGPLDRWLPDQLTPTLACGLVYLALGAWATTVLGLHELLGAYFAGALAPSALARRLRPEVVGKIALFGFAPLYFAHRGWSIDGSVLTWSAAAGAVALCVVAALAKLAAIQLYPPVKAMPLVDRTRLGVLLQCKGLMEIVAASILKDSGLLSAQAFAVLVTVAIISTMLTIPTFKLVTRGRAAREIEVSTKS